MIFVENAAQLAPCVEKIKKSSWAAVDTEADSLHHYAEKLSLLQVTAGEDDFVIDPLVSLDLVPLAQILCEKDLLFHAADSDIRLLKKSLPFSPQRMFDTLLAAQILGYPKMGLVDLAEKHCGLRLSKAEQKADWSRRPLEAKLLAYAANDTHYLKTIRDAMEGELKEAGRLDWHRQQCVKLLQTLEQLKTHEADPERDWQIKGSKELKGFSLTALRELWHWREKVAEAKDRPPFKVLNSEYLVQIAKWAGEHPGQDIGQWQEAPRNVKGEHRDTVNQILRTAAGLPQAQWQYPERTKPKKRWTEQDSKILGVLKVVREKLAADLKINASLVATNAVLEALAEAKPRESEELKKMDILLDWQIDVAGEEFLKALKTP